MNTEPFTIITQAPLTTFDHMVIGIVLVVVMAILGARRIARLVTARMNKTGHDWEKDR